MVKSRSTTRKIPCNFIVKAETSIKQMDMECIENTKLIRLFCLSAWRKPTYFICTDYKTFCNVLLYEASPRDNLRTFCLLWENIIFSLLKGLLLCYINLGLNSIDKGHYSCGNSGLFIYSVLKNAHERVSKCLPNYLTSYRTIGLKPNKYQAKQMIAPNLVSKPEKDVLFSEARFSVARRIVVSAY